jgi:hypothetical protein
MLGFKGPNDFKGPDNFRVPIGFRVPSGVGPSPSEPKVSSKRLFRFPFAPLALAACALIVGCNPPPRPNAEKKPRPESERPLAVVPEPEFSAESKWRDEIALRFANEAPFDLWDAYFMGGEQIGYSHVQAELTDRKDEVRYRTTERIRIRRGEQLLDQELIQSSTESLTGQFKRFDSELRTNSQRTFNEGTVAGNKLVISTRRDGAEETKREITWQPAIGGLLALQQHLREKPMVAGDKRTISVLAPLVYEVGQLQLEAIGMAAVSMLTGDSKMLLEIDSTSFIGGNEVFKMTLWTDESGNVLKQYAPSAGLIIMRADQTSATQFFDPQQDILQTFQVPLAKKIANPTELVRAGYRLSSSTSQNLGGLFNNLPGQLTRVDENGKVEVAVIMDGTTELSDLEPSDADRRPGPLVQSNDNLVTQLASIVKVTGKAEMAQKLSKLVYSHITQKDTSAGFDSAARVALTATGDCTEHSVLLAALCRSRGIPARIAAGLVYQESPEGPSMRYHMWTLAFVDSRWLQLDAMRADGLASADRILFTTDTLASGSEFATVKKVAALLGQLEIEIGNTVATDSTPQDSKDPQNAPELPTDDAQILDSLLNDIDQTSTG